MATKASNASEIQIIEIDTSTVRMAVVGRTPLILNRMWNKSGPRELLLPKGKKTAAEKASTLKHQPWDEFRNSAETFDDESSATLLAIQSTAFKKAMATAALDLPGTKKTQIGRLTWISGELVGIYGEPRIFSAITRNSDINRTPDVRTRCIIPKWAAIVEVSFVRPIMREQSVANLMAAAGITVGVGDFRPEKGAGNYGQFEVVDMADERFADITSKWGRQAQKDAMDKPAFYDKNTEELLTWYDTEVRRRGFKVA